MTFAYDKADLSTAFTAGIEAADATMSLDATAGRAAYVDRAQLVGVPDAGAAGVSEILKGIRDTLLGSSL